MSNEDELERDGLNHHNQDCSSKKDEEDTPVKENDVNEESNSMKNDKGECKQGFVQNSMTPYSKDGHDTCKMGGGYELKQSSTSTSDPVENDKRQLMDAITPKPNSNANDRQMKSDNVGQPSAKKTRLIDTTNRFSHWKIGNRYQIMRVLGQGSYGEVVQARDKYAVQDESVENSDNFVAIKRIIRPFEQEVEATRIYREVAILKNLQDHECIIKLQDVLISPDNYASFQDLYLIFEYVDTDLHKIILSPQYLSTEHVQIFLYQLLKGVKYLHSANVIHRDLKPANILLNEDCSLKICDFGLARVVQQQEITATSDLTPGSKVDATPPIRQHQLTRQLTRHVVTRWYRAPELILMQPYTFAVDVWSLGCILAELLNMQEDNIPAYQDRQPLFPGGKCAPLSGDISSIDDRLDQLSVIFSVIGTPSEEDVRSVGQTNDFTMDYMLNRIKNVQPSTLKSKFPGSDNIVIDLLTKMLQFNPNKRCTIDEALNHEFLKDIRNESEEISWNKKIKIMDDCIKMDLKQLKQRTYDEVLWYKSRRQKY